MKTGMTDDTWGQVQDAILKSVGTDNYKTWIEPLEFSELTDGVARFNVPTNFVGNWVNRNYADLWFSFVCTCTCRLANSA